ncbi:FMN-linked oxidoreductase [Thozetella sp. PMI_491]|nr:FMN-linked oxidoreductase [Thozetella sp. PMI_491]
MSSSLLFTPAKVGTSQLTHRVVLAPLTRHRASDEHVPTDMMVEYYSQRASTPGTLLITEATAISQKYGGMFNAPGIYTEEQIAAWHKVSDAVHSKGSYIVCQLWAAGRAASPAYAEKHGFSVAAPSPIPLDPHGPVPEEYTIEQIKDIIETFVAAAKNAMRAGFDGIELHAANGHLIDQFLQDCSNRRTDQYGGSIENRSRFVVELVRAVVIAIGPEKTAIRFSPFSEFLSMGMKHPEPQFLDVITRLNGFGLAWLHMVNPRIKGDADVEGTGSVDFAVENWKGTFIVAGGFDGETAKKYLDARPDKKVLVSFGRHFIANPDLVFRLRENIALNHYDRPSFYLAKSARGYIDQPFSAEFEELHGSAR